MRTGRPPEWRIDPGSTAPVDIVARELDGDDRLTIPKSCLSGLPWLRPPSTFLMVLDEPGRAVFRQLSQEDEDRLVERRRSLEAELEDDGLEAEESLIFFDDKYRRARLDSNGRIPLAGAPLLHIAGDLRKRCAVYVVRFRERLELWSVSFRNGRRTGRAPQESIGSE